MSEDRNNRTGGNQLPRRKILRGKDSFDTLFKNGIRIAAGHIDLRYLTKESNQFSVQVAFIAGRKLGNAVTRNRCKRLLREAYRLQQHILDPISTQRSFEIEMAIIVKNAPITLQIAMVEVHKLLTTLVNRLNQEPTHPWNIFLFFWCVVTRLWSLPIFHPVADTNLPVAIMPLEHYKNMAHLKELGWQLNVYYAAIPGQKADTTPSHQQKLTQTQQIYRSNFG